LPEAAAAESSLLFLGAANQDGVGREEMGADRGGRRGAARVMFSITSAIPSADAPTPPYSVGMFTPRTPAPRARARCLPESPGRAIAAARKRVARIAADLVAQRLVDCGISKSSIQMTAVARSQ
jgi:hypothetical protein